MSSLRQRRGVGGYGTDIPPGGPRTGGIEPAPGQDRGGVFRFARDPATDETTPQGFATLGLAGNPDPPTPLGRQTSELDANGSSRRTSAGRPGRFRTSLFQPRERDLDHEVRGTLAPGTIRRNVRYAINSIPVPGLFSWAANELGFVTELDPARPPQDEYLVSSAHLMLPDSLSTVVSGSSKPAPGLEPNRGGATIQAGASTGYPVVAPQIPSYGSRIPLRRPRGLVSVDNT